MKVLMFGWEFPPIISGGLGTACRGITQGLVHSGVEVVFVIPTTKGREDQPSDIRLVGADTVPVASGKGAGRQRDRARMLKKKLKLVAMESGRHWSPYYTGRGEKPSAAGRPLREEAEGTGPGNRPGLLTFTGRYGGYLMGEVVNYGRVGFRLGQTETYDVIHAHDWLTCLAGVEAKRASGKPLVVHMHATEFDRSGEHVNRDIYDLERFGLEQADRVIAVSHLTKGVLVERYGLAPDKVTVVHNAVSRERRNGRLGITRNLPEKVVLFLGRVTMQKGPDYFLEAAHLVLKRMADVRFVMAGAGDLLEPMITRMARLKIAHRFHFTGFLQGIDVERMYAWSDLYIMPSVSEPFGLTPFEAILYDVPIIISRQSGAAELLPHALQVDFWDTATLAHHICRVLSDESLAARIVEQCQDDIKHVSWNEAGRKIRTIYEEMTGGAV